MGGEKGTSRYRAMGVLVVTGLALQGCGGGDSEGGPPGPSVAQLRASCEALKGMVVEGVTVTRTARFESTAASPAFCQVMGTRSPYLDIEIDVPDEWSGRYWQVGGGGFDGRIPSAVTTDAAGVVTAVSPALASKGAVYAASNGGNRANVPAQAAPAVWADGSEAGRLSATDYAYAALGTTMRFGKAVTKTIHGKAPSHSYFSGCSNGGRNAYIVAQRWPQEFDGIVSGCETMDMAGQVSAWLQAASYTGSAAALSAAQTSAAFTAARAACDGLDGAVDNTIGNPLACTFDPGTLQCGAAGASSDPALCLSPAQVGTLRSFVTDLKLQDGSTIYSGYAWANGLGQGWGGLGGGFAMLATGDPAWLTPAKQAGFQLNTDYYQLGSGLSRLGADHDKASIAGYVSSGGKLIAWHAGSDGLLSANDHYRNWSTMVGLAKQQGLADPNTATRFFIVPGASHGAGQDLREVDWATSIIGWVENGEAPQQMTYSFSSAGTRRSMPVCQYPKYPKYNGAGDVNASSSYTCS